MSLLPTAGTRGPCSAEASSPCRCPWIINQIGKTSMRGLRRMVAKLSSGMAIKFLVFLQCRDRLVNTKRSTTVLKGIEFSFLGCLSTVSTFAAEVYTMRRSGQIARAFAYATATFLLSFVLGTLIYSVPVWVKHYQ